MQIQEKLISLMGQPRELIFSTSAVYLARDLVVPYALLNLDERAKIVSALQRHTHKIALFSTNGEKCIEIAHSGVDDSFFRESVIVSLFRVLNRVYT
jgi:hypothetical protein